MLRNVSVIRGYAIAASDGRLGTVSDFLFDDVSWSVRWLVVETGNWLPGRKILLPPSVLGLLDPARQEVPVKLARRQVEDSPIIDTDLPVSRQMETNTYDYYGWSPYWGPGMGLGPAGMAMGVSPSLGYGARDVDVGNPGQGNGNPHLRSAESVAGYHIHARDGEIGHVEDFLVDDTTWRINYLIVDTKNWWPAKKVLISPRLAGEIDWAHRLVNLTVDRQKVKDSPAYDASILVDRIYEEDFRSHYGGERGETVNETVL